MDYIHVFRLCYLIAFLVLTAYTCTSSLFSLSLSLSPHPYAPKAISKPHEIYIPPTPLEDEQSIFATVNDTNFDRCNEIPVKVTGRDPPQNIQTFDECNFYGEIYNNMKRCQYYRPTPVQKYAIPIIMAGRDLMACVQYGLGKSVSIQALW